MFLTVEVQSYCSLQIWVLSYVLKWLTEEVWSHQVNMTVTTHAAVHFYFDFVFTLDLYSTHYITYFMEQSFYAYLAPPIVVGVLLTLSLDPEYKTTKFFQMYFQFKKYIYYIRVNTVCLFMHSIVGLSSFSTNSSISEVWRGSDQPVALLRHYWTFSSSVLLDRLFLIFLLKICHRIFIGFRSGMLADQ